MNKKKAIQKLISVLLCVALMGAVFAPVGAAEDSEAVAGAPLYLYVDNRDLQCSVLAVTYDETYNALGTEPTISVSYTKTSGEDEDGEAASEECVLQIGPEAVRRELFTVHYDQLQPQLFIRLPGYIGEGDTQIPPSAILFVSAGAYQSADGAPSPAMELPISQFIKREISAGFRSEKVSVDHEILAYTKIQAYMDFRRSDYVCLWNDNAVFYLDDAPITTKDGSSWYAKVPGRGKHALRMVLNDFVYTDPLYFRSVTRVEARLEQCRALGTAQIAYGTAEMLISVPLLIVPSVALSEFLIGVLSVGSGIGGIFLSFFLLYLHTDRFYQGGTGHDCDSVFRSSHWTFV